MRLKLYKMWLDFCKSEDVLLANEHTIDEHTSTGLVTFNYKHELMEIKKPSPEYDAWRAFYLAKNSEMIVRFIAKNFSLLKEHFPTTCVFFDLHQVKDPLKLTKSKDMHFINELRKALYEDAIAFDERKSRERCMAK